MSCILSISLRHTETVHRSGAVEQLRVHVRNLSMLGVDGAMGSKGRVELFEKGYGKDAASIAKEAITYGDEPPPTIPVNVLILCHSAKENGFDVVLIDTAGRMQDNEVSGHADLVEGDLLRLLQPLMRALAKVRPFHVLAGNRTYSQTACNSEQS